MSTTTLHAVPVARAAGIGMRAMETATALFFLLAGLDLAPPLTGLDGGIDGGGGNVHEPSLNVCSH